MRNIKQIRKSLGMTQREFSKLFGITPAAISNFEHGKRAPNLRLAYRIIDILCKRFGIKVALHDLYTRPKNKQ